MTKDNFDLSSIFSDMRETSETSLISKPAKKEENPINKSIDTKKEENELKPYDVSVETTYDKDGQPDEKAYIDVIMSTDEAEKQIDLSTLKKRMSLRKEKTPTKVKSVDKDIVNYMMLLDGDELLPEQDIVLRHYIASASLTVAARSAGVSHKQVMEWAREDDLFTQRLREATDILTGMLEAEGLRRALRSSDRLLIKMLEAFNPEKYGRTTRVDNNINARVDINVNSWSELSRKAVEILDAEEVRLIEDKEAE